MTAPSSTGVVARFVGRLEWFGRAIGNHHLGVGPFRAVDFVKGANMAFCSSAVDRLRFDKRLRGMVGVNADFAFSVALKRAGWVLLYDPLVAVDHYRGPIEEPRQFAAIHKRTQVWPTSATMRSSRCGRRYPNFVAIAYLLWSVLIGTGNAPGLLQAIRYMPRLGVVTWNRFSAIHVEKMAAFKVVLFGPIRIASAGVSSDHTRSAGARSVNV